MRTIILTGYDNRQFKELVEKKREAGCYLCKRISEGIFLVKDGNEEGQGRRDLEFDWVTRIEDEQEFMWLLCNECSRFMETFVKKILFRREFGKQLNLEGGECRE